MMTLSEMCDRRDFFFFFKFKARLQLCKSVSPTYLDDRELFRIHVGSTGRYDETIRVALATRHVYAATKVRTPSGAPGKG